MNDGGAATLGLLADSGNEENEGGGGLPAMSDRTHSTAAAAK